MESTLVSYLGDRANCFALFGAAAAAYVALKLLCSIWSGVKVYFLGKALGLGTDLKKLGDWAVITGSTDGIGKGYAYELARKGINVVLVSRSPEKLIDVATEIAYKFKVQTKTVAIDFSQGPSIYEKLRKELEGLDIGVLVNNVGVSYPYPMYYGEIPKDKVTKVVLPSMLEKKKGAIINISSASGLDPCPLLTPYAASKVFVDFFSRGLQGEYKSKGIIFQVVMPFFVATKLSKIRKASFFAPDPISYARSALDTVGLESRTFGCLAHAIQGYVTTSLPSCVYEMLSTSVLKGARARAIKKAAKKQ